MPAFVVKCLDGEGALALRPDNRPAHLTYMESLGPKLLLAGPLLNEDDTPKGSLFIYEADTAEDARALAENDPFSKMGIFEKIEVTKFKLVTGEMVGALK